MGKGTASAPKPTFSERYQRYCKKAEIIHHFAENLAQTLGVFHGINDTGKKLEVEGDFSRAVNTVLFDQLQLMIIRVCALCGKSTKPDDASLEELVEAITEPDFQAFLVEKERKWQNAYPHRIKTAHEIPKYSRVLKARWSVLTAETDALKRIRHYRNKVLAHATTGLDPASAVVISDIWRVARLALSVAKYIRLLLERQEWNYLDHSADGKASGEELARALYRDSKRRNKTNLARRAD
jgi:hypothetical protein